MGRERERGGFWEGGEERGIRVRGLPFSLSERDVVYIFRRYSPIEESIKLGHRGGRKSG